VAAILVTGMSGTGKSAALAELAARGFPVVDTDYGGYSVEKSPWPGAPPEQLWVEDRVDDLLTRAAEHPGVLVVAGTVSNQARFRPRFAAVVLLSAPAHVLLQRLADRTTNDFGKTRADRERILADLADVEPLLRAGADLEIDTTRPLAEVADELVRLVSEVAARR
jgi:dephospho-CoA kinase